MCIKKELKKPLRNYRKRKKQAPPKQHKTGQIYKKNPNPQLQSTQSMKPIKVESSSTIDNLVFDHKRETKELLSSCIENSSSLKAMLFLALHIVQNKQKGLACQTFFHLLLTLTPFQLKRVSLRERGFTQVVLKRENSCSHKDLVMLQWMRRWSTVSSCSRQR